MSEMPEGTTRDVADDGTQESPSSATAETPGGPVASPADQMPAGELDDQRDHSHEESDPGVGPAHVAGTTRGEDQA